jgi:hypothetical protein
MGKCVNFRLNASKAYPGRKNSKNECQGEAFGRCCESGLTDIVSLRY